LFVKVETKRSILFLAFHGALAPGRSRGLDRQSRS